MVEIKETDCQTIAQIESRIYHFLVCESFSIKYTTSFPTGWATPFWTTRSKWTEDTGRWLFHVGFKVKHLSIFCLHFSWSWRTTSEVLRSWPRVSAMSNQLTQIGGKSLLVSFIASERGGKKLIQDDLRLDTTRKDDLHYAERWSQDRGSLSPTTQSPQRSRFYNPPRFPQLPKTFSNLPSGHPAGHLVQRQEEPMVPWETEGTMVTPGRVLLIS